MIKKKMHKKDFKGLTQKTKQEKRDSKKLNKTQSERPSRKVPAETGIYITTYYNENYMPLNTYIFLGYFYFFIFVSYFDLSVV